MIPNENVTEAPGSEKTFGKARTMMAVATAIAAPCAITRKLMSQKSGVSLTCDAGLPSAVPKNRKA